SRSVKGQVVDQSGKPLATALFAGKLKEFPSWQSLDAEGRFEIVGYDPESPRTVAFVDPGRCLAAHLELSGPVSNPLVVKLEPAGKAKGRIVDEHGDPIPKVMLNSWHIFAAARDQSMQQAYKPLPLPPGDSANFRDRIITDADGRFELNGL